MPTVTIHQRDMWSSGVFYQVHFSGRKRKKRHTVVAKPTSDFPLWKNMYVCLSSYLIPSLYQRNRPSICLPVWSQSRSCNPPFCTRGCPVPTFPCSQCPCFWSATSASQTGLSEHRLFHPLAQLYNFSRLPHYWCYARAGCVGETELATEEAWGLPAVLAIPTHFEWFVWMAWWMFSSNRSLML